MIEARARYEPQARFTTWMYTIAHNLLVDHWRRAGLTLVDLEHAPAVHSADNPARQAEVRQALSRLQALGALPAAQREAFLLHEEAGLSVADRRSHRVGGGSDEEPVALCDRETEGCCSG